MRKIENQKIQASELIAKIENKIGVIIGFTDEQFQVRFEVERARDNGYGAIEIFDFYGNCRGLGLNETVEILGYFNLD
jgi:hypothetical protein